jgi:phosphoribosylglycinamide formyltransferase-1
MPQSYPDTPHAWRKHDACENGAISGRVVFVGTDNPEAKGLARAARHKIPSFVVDYKDIIRRQRIAPETLALPADCDLDALRAKCGLFEADASSTRVAAFLQTRVAAEAALLEAITAFPFDLLILAGFMRNLTPYFIDRVNQDRSRPRIMNIHPALLPAFPGTDGYGDTYRYGCKVGGCTVHFVDYGEDTGPIIGQRSFTIGPEDSLEDVKTNGLKEEWKLYPACIELFAWGRLRLVEKTHTLPGGQTCRRSAVEILPPPASKPS